MKKNRIKYPIEYNLKPDNFEAGTHWLTANIKNVGDEELTALEIKLNSLDTYSLTVYGSGQYLSQLKPKQKELVPFQISLLRSAQVYLSLDGFKNGKTFSWQSAFLKITKGDEPASLVSLFSLSEPYPPVGRVLRCEAIIDFHKQVKDLTIEFWLDNADKDFKQLEVMNLDKYQAVTTKRYAAEFTPKIKGMHTIHAYLYHQGKQIGHQINRVYVE